MLSGNVKVSDELMCGILYDFYYFINMLFTGWRQINTFSLRCFCQTQELFMNTLTVLFVECASFLCDDTEYFLSINKCWILTTCNDTFYVGRWQLQVSLNMHFSSLETIQWERALIYLSVYSLLKRKLDFSYNLTQVLHDIVAHVWKPFFYPLCTNLHLCWKLGP